MTCKKCRPSMLWTFHLPLSPKHFHQWLQLSAKARVALCQISAKMRRLKLPKKTREGLVVGFLDLLSHATGMSSNLLPWMKVNFSNGKKLSQLTRFKNKYGIPINSPRCLVRVPSVRYFLLNSFKSRKTGLALTILTNKYIKEHTNFHLLRTLSWLLSRSSTRRNCRTARMGQITSSPRLRSTGTLKSAIVYFGCLKSTKMSISCTWSLSISSKVPSSVRFSRTMSSRRNRSR